jgi:tRNA-2-methylthio-N6-dimethylallyladenosine synthase
MAESFTYHVWTIGCQMNEADAGRASAALERAGGRRVEDVREADVALLTTCVVRQQVEDKAAGRLRYMAELKGKKPGLKVVLMGCMVGRDGGKSQGLPEKWPVVDLFVGPSETETLEKWLEEEWGDERREKGEGGCGGDGEVRKGGVTGLVPVVLGCSHACSYCVIPYRRGAERSRASGEVLAEVRGLAERGVKEVTLLGQIIDRYGMDLPGEMGLAGLLREVAKVEGIRRVRFLTSHPNWMTDDILYAVGEEPKICPAFEIPVQAGNDEVLERMRRGYKAEDWLRLVEKIRGRFPEAGISTDVIVGFCGETSAQFEDTVRLMEAARPDMMRIAKYSPRPQTLSARTMEDDVPPEEKERRRVALEELLRKQLEEKHAGMVGREVEILVESVEENGRRRGRTREGKLVFAEAQGGREGELLKVKIDWAGAFSWIGRGEDHR